MPAAAELAKQVANTEFVPKALRGNPAAIAACILYGDELGIGPLQSLAKISVIEGKPSLSAEAQRALILSAGHDMWVVEANNTKVTVAGKRSNSEHVSTVTWTLDDAKRAGIGGRQNWRTYPRQMLMARATAELARLIFADAVGGLLATEELEDGDVEAAEGEVAPTAKRKRRSVAAPQTTGRPSETNGAAAELPPLPDEDLEGSGAAAATPSPAGESASDTAGASPSPHASDDAAPSGAPAPTYEDNIAALNALVGQLRDTGEITTRQLWVKVARMRKKPVDELIDLYDGVGEDGELHWSPLRAIVRPEEAVELRQGLGKLWAEKRDAVAV
jgi:hypothetical protein